MRFCFQDSTLNLLHCKNVSLTPSNTSESFYLYYWRRLTGDLFSQETAQHQWFAGINNDIGGAGSSVTFSVKGCYPEAGWKKSISPQCTNRDRHWPLPAITTLFLFGCRNVSSLGLTDLPLCSLQMPQSGCGLKCLIRGPIHQNVKGKSWNLWLTTDTSRSGKKRVTYVFLLSRQALSYQACVIKGLITN